jgi:hypothetical protein
MLYLLLLQQLGELLFLLLPVLGEKLDDLLYQHVGAKYSRARLHR